MGGGEGISSLRLMFFGKPVTLALAYQLCSWITLLSRLPGTPSVDFCIAFSSLCPQISTTHPLVSRCGCDIWSQAVRI